MEFSFKEMLMTFKECFKVVSRVFQDSFKGALWKIEGCFNGDLGWVQGYLKEVQKDKIPLKFCQNCLGFNGVTGWVQSDQPTGLKLDWLQTELDQGEQKGHQDK